MNFRVKSTLTVCGVFALTFLISFLILRGEWAKNDDYVDLGTFNFGQWDFKTAFQLLNDRDAAAGRLFHVLWISAIFPHIHSVDQLELFRVLNASIISLLITTVFVKMTKKYSSRER